MTSASRALLWVAASATVACGALSGLDQLENVDCAACDDAGGGGVGPAGAGPESDATSAREADVEPDGSPSSFEDHTAPPDGGPGLDAADGADATDASDATGDAYDGPPSVLEAQVVTAEDDAEESTLDGQVYLDSSDLELTYDDYVDSDQVIGIRFVNVTIPRNAKIVTAYVQLTANDVGTAAATVKIQGQAADNPATFTSQSLSISTRPRTVASSTWAVPAWATKGESNANQRTPSLAPVLQEIVDRAGWASGGAVVILVTGTTPPNARSAWAYDGLSQSAPKLHVEYR